MTAGGNVRAQGRCIRVHGDVFFLQRSMWVSAHAAPVMCVRQRKTSCIRMRRMNVAWASHFFGTTLELFKPHRHTGAQHHWLTFKVNAGIVPADWEKAHQHKHRQSALAQANGEDNGECREVFTRPALHSTGCMIPTYSPTGFLH